MKLYQEVAHCKNAEGKISYLVLFNTKSEQYEYVTWERFGELVKAEEVQYFIWDYYENEPMVHYTEEEMLDKSKISKKLMNEITSTQAFFDNDGVLSEENIKLLLEDRAIVALAALPGKLPLIGAAMPLLLIGSTGRIVDFVTHLDSSLQASLIQKEDRVYFQMVEMLAKRDIYRLANFKGVIVDYTTLNSLGYNHSELIKKVKPISLVKGTNRLECASIIEVCTKINEATYADLDYKEEPVKLMDFFN